MELGNMRSSRVKGWFWYIWQKIPRWTDQMPEGFASPTYRDPRLSRTSGRKPEMMAKVSHPNVVSVYSRGRKRSLVYCHAISSRKSLADQLREKGPCSLSTALKITRQVIAG